MDYSLEVQERFRSPAGAGEFAEGTPQVVAGEAEDRTLNVWFRFQISVAGTVTRKGPTLVEIQGLEVELPLSRYLLIVRNQDKPGLIGRVGTYLGDRRINIADRRLITTTPSWFITSFW